MSLAKGVYWRNKNSHCFSYAVLQFKDEGGKQTKCEI